MKIRMILISLTTLFILTNFYCSSSKEDEDNSSSKGDKIGKTENGKLNTDGKSALIAKTKPRIIVDTAEFNFGEIPEGAATTHFFKITNVGVDTLKITDVETSCGCTVPEPRKMNLGPKETTRIKVTFDSRGKVGYNEKSVIIFSNDPVEPQKQLLIKGKVLPKSN